MYLYIVGTASRFGREGVTRIQILNHGGDLAISSLVLPPTPGYVRPHPEHPDARVRSPPGGREAPPGAGSARREAPGVPEGGGPWGYNLADTIHTRVKDKWKSFKNHLCIG